MSENPDEIRADIERTRQRLGTNVDAVADKVTPSHIVQRQTNKVKDKVFGVKDKVMGVADSMGNSASNAGGSVSEGMSAAGSAVQDAPGQLVGKAQGNPMAAGLIAFGAGLLAASLIPASEKERVAADNLKTAAKPMTDELAGAAKEMAQGLKEPAQEAMENVKATAADAAKNVKSEGQSAVTEVKDSATEAQQNVRNA
ncbi:DUF3618 domain-containing protein [Arthrobacter zhangbolii]|uniref:DUF3618 domain-containing protein n=1 Tax=Arthrobacter zhangbolii TaxID=2886936 RepID=A0A9X1M8T5_9MICC|nr:DUF3618 domain-containing protein [Arthrobacter zhangbolii]MCC3272850.1 DUF3618 domain-containing protein [Arthrobacter zhangbolii]UON92916.1 DUF3618 domain-containing protein [Arthrobacter zhangbolii]